MTSPFCVYIASVNTDRYSHFLLKMMTKQVSAIIYWTIAIEEQTRDWFGMYSIVFFFHCLSHALHLNLKVVNHIWVSFQHDQTLLSDIVDIQGAWTTWLFRLCVGQSDVNKTSLQVTFLIISSLFQNHFQKNKDECPVIVKRHKTLVSLRSIN